MILQQATKLKRYCGFALCRGFNLVAGGLVLAVTLLVKRRAGAEPLAETDIVAHARDSDDRVVTASRDAMLISPSPCAADKPRKPRLSLRSRSRTAIRH